MTRIEDNKYYTPTELAKRLIDTTFEVLKSKGHVVSEVVEPSAGNGAFSNQMDCVAYDISPEGDGIIKADFIAEPIAYKEGRLCIGNPPFGRGNSQSVRFYKKCCRIGDYVAFIQPISQFNNNLQLYDFDLIHSEDLGIVDYSSVSLHCCFNIYVRPVNGKPNPKPDYRLKDVTILEYRRDGSGYSRESIKPGYDYAIGMWGNGTVGRCPEYVGQFAQEAYFYVHKREYLPRVLELLEYNAIRTHVKSISMMKISRMRLYKYLKDNIEGIE